LHCFLIEHVENTDSERKKMAPVILAVNMVSIAPRIRWWAFGQLQNA
jgi:hypothetical protein